MKIMIPLADGRLTAHFGHCEEFACVTLHEETREVANRERLSAPPHQPGLLPVWLAEHGANVVIAGGMGQRAQDMLRDQGIEVVVGAPAETPEELVKRWRDGSLAGGANLCDH